MHLGKALPLLTVLLLSPACEQLISLERFEEPRKKQDDAAQDDAAQDDDTHDDNTQDDASAADTSAGTGGASAEDSTGAAGAPTLSSLHRRTAADTTGALSDSGASLALDAGQ